MKNLSLLAALALVSAGAMACKKSEPAGSGDQAAETANKDPADQAGEGDGTSEEKTEEQEAAATDSAQADYIKVLAKHAPDPKPDDPVEVEIKKFRVVKADFDPDNLEGASAELELDLASLSSGVEKRDGHLKSPDYLDVGKFATARVVVSDVKKDGDAYEAVARVSAHGVDKEFPVSFEVTDKSEDSIRIEGQHQFQRADFELGKKEGDSTQQDLVIEMALTLEKTS